MIRRGFPDDLQGHFQFSAGPDQQVLVFHPVNLANTKTFSSRLTEAGELKMFTGRCHWE